MFERFCDAGTVQPHDNMKRCRLRVASPAKVLAAGFAMLYCSLRVAADQLDQWYRRNPLPTADRLYGVAYGTNCFVAVGSGGAVAASKDGTNWVSQNAGTSGNLLGVAYGNGILVAVGDHGLILSSDGSNWSNMSFGTDALLNGVTFGADTFVAVGIDLDGNAAIFTSS